MNISFRINRNHVFGAVASIVLGSFLLANTALAATLFSEDFESTNFAKWTQADTGAAGMWRIDSSRYTGKYSAHVIGSTGATDDVLRKVFSTDTYSTPTVSFFYKASSLDYKSNARGEFDQFFVEYSTNGSTWTLIKEVNGKMSSELDNSWRQVSASVPSHSGFQLRFRAHLSDSGDRVWIDDVLISGTPKENTQARCTDRVDNDIDGYIDATDSDCEAFYNDLTVLKNGTGVGTVTSSPAGISCGVDCLERYLSTALVNLNALVTRGFQFAGWSGACAGFSDCSVSMDTDKSVTATFNALTAFTLSVANNPADGGTVSGTGVNCGTDCIDTVYEYESLTLTAVPNFGFEFAGWTGDCTNAAAECSLQINGNTSATANYNALVPGICGNTVVEWNEQCDDGNLIAGDGCSATCTVPTLVCTGTASYPICTFVE